MTDRHTHLLNNGPIEDVLEVLEEMEPENRSEAIFVWLYPQTVDQLLEHFGADNWEPEIGYDARRLWLIGFYAGRNFTLSREKDTLHYSPPERW